MKDFLRKVQGLGWLIERVERNSCVAKCSGCSLRLRLYPRGAVPLREPVDGAGRVVESMDEVRSVLKDRRDELLLSIGEVEEAAGMAVDHLAKFEPQGAARTPTVPILIYWAQALGYDVVLRPRPLPGKTLAQIESTRDRVDARRQRVERAKRLAG